MSVFRGGKNGGNYYSNLTQPVVVDLSFSVANANTNGLGITSLKSNGWVRNVFMHTTQTPGVNNGATNPNPAAGYALIQLKQNFNIYLGLSGYSIVSPLAGSNINIDASDAALTVGNPYIINVLGTSTAADWAAVGLPAGLTPTVGQSFIAIATGAGTGTGKVQAPAAVGSGIQLVDVIGNPNLEIANSSIASNGGAYVLVRFLGATNSSTTTLVATAPANNSVVSMSLKFDMSSADPLMQNGDPLNI